MLHRRDIGLRNCVRGWIHLIRFVVVVCLALGHQTTAQTNTTESEWIRPAKSVVGAQAGLRAETFDVPTGLRAIPSFDNLVPFDVATVPDIDFGGNQPNVGLGRKQPFAARFSGWLLVPTTASYAFDLNSDDGARLVLDGTVVIDNDGSHPARRKQGVISLAKGHHEIHIEHFNSYGSWTLTLQWSQRDGRQSWKKLKGSIFEGGTLHPEEREFEAALEDGKAALRLGNLDALDRVATRLIVLNAERSEGHALLAVARNWKGDIGASEESFLRSLRFADPGMRAWIDDLKKQPPPPPSKSAIAPKPEGRERSATENNAAPAALKPTEFASLVAAAKLDPERQREWDITERLCVQFFEQPESLERTKLGAQALKRLAQSCVEDVTFIPAWIRRFEVAASLGAVTVGTCTMNALQVMRGKLPNTPEFEQSRLAIDQSIADATRLGWTGPQTRFDLTPSAKPLVICVAGQTYIADTGSTIRAVKDAESGHPRAAIFAPLYTHGSGPILYPIRIDPTDAKQPLADMHTVRIHGYRDLALQSALLRQLAQDELLQEQTNGKVESRNRRAPPGYECAPIASPLPGTWDNNSKILRQRAAEAGDPVAIYVHALADAIPVDELTVFVRYPFESASAPLEEFTQIEAGDIHAIGLTSHSDIRVWRLERANSGENESTALWTPPSDLGRVVEVAAGNRYCMALRSDGTVQSWGDPKNPNCDVPVDLRDIREIESGPSWSLAIRSDDSLACWGIAEADSARRPPADLGPVRTVRCDDSSTIAICKDGTLRIWGSRKKSGTKLPTAEDSDGFIRVAIDGSGGAAIDQQGNIKCWRNGFASIRDGKCTIPVERVQQFTFQDDVRLLDTEGTVWIGEARAQPIAWEKDTDQPTIRFYGTRFGRPIIGCGTATEADLRERRRKALATVVDPLRRSSILGFPPAAQALADVLVLLGERENALKELEHAIALANHDDVREHLTEIAEEWRSSLNSGTALIPTFAHPRFGGLTELREPQQLYTLQGIPLPAQ